MTFRSRRRPSRRCHIRWTLCAIVVAGIWLVGAFCAGKTLAKETIRPSRAGQRHAAARAAIITKHKMRSVGALIGSVAVAGIGSTYNENSASG